MNMKLLRFSVYLAVALLSVLSLGSCTKEEIDYREHDYGYVQFKLYKEASYPGTKASLEYLRDVCKIQVSLKSDIQTVVQTLVLSSSNDAAAEYGLRSDKLKLLAGNYKVLSFILFDKLDNPTYLGGASAESFEIVPGGLISFDLTAPVTPRGQVRFTMIKDLSSLNKPSTKAATSEYTFDEIAKVDLTLSSRTLGKDVNVTGLKTSFDVHFNEKDDVEDGYQTSSLLCDSLVFLPAGEYYVKSYALYKEGQSIPLETKVYTTTNEFHVNDNQLTDVDVPVSLHESDEYIKDYYALKAIWEALGGKDWYYIGESFNTGANWNFNKDVDLWGDQPGVQLHANGRVALIDLSNFGFYGEMPEELGQLSELIELYLGTHNDTNLYTYESNDYSSNANRMSRMDAAKEYLRKTHPATQFSEPIARAMMEKNVSIPEI